MLDITTAGPAEDPLLIEHYLAIWDSYGTPEEHYASDARETVVRFIEENRGNRTHAGFVARIDGQIAGSAICCLLRSPFPDVLKPDVRRRGYIWSVYTVRSHRGKGVGKALTTRAIDHLRDNGCTHVVLHASEAGTPMYEKLGFTRAGEMRLAL